MTALGAPNIVADYVVAPAGVAGSPINLALTNPAELAGDVTVTICGVPAGWTVSQGTDNGDGTWTVQTNDVSALTITTPVDYAGAMTLSIAMTWTNADGTSGLSVLTDNVEAFAPGNPIFAWSRDDTLTGSSGDDLFVFSQPIGDDVVFDFTATADKIDLIGYAGFTSFADVLAHTADDSSGNARLQLADGQSITLIGVQTSSLTAANFVFNQTPVMTNAGTMVIGNGAMLPLSGVVTNSGTISLNSSGSETQLQLIQYGVTLQGGGQVLLSDSPGNVIAGTLASVIFNNVDNVIEGAGRIGNGTLTLTNGGSITATGNYALIIDTGANTIVNSGTLGATGAGGLYIASALENYGELLANSGHIGVGGIVSGGGAAIITGGAALFLHDDADLAVTFGANESGTLVLFDSVHFTGRVSGFDEDDAFLFRDIDFGTGTTFQFAAASVGEGGDLTISDGTDTATIHLNGLFDGSAFHIQGLADGGTMLIYGSGFQHSVPIEPLWM